MRTRLATLLAVSLCCGSPCVDALCTGAHAQDYSRLHLPGPLGRYFGIGYSAGYHACDPVCAGADCAGAACSGLGQEVHSFAAPLYQPGPIFGPGFGPAGAAAAACPQCSQPGPYSNFAPETVAPAAAPSLPHAPIQQPPRGPAPTGPASSSPAPSGPAARDPASPSDRAGFLKRLPHPSVQGSKKAAVARSSILEPEAR